MEDTATVAGPSANAVMESSAKMSTALRALIDGGYSDHVAFACEIQMKMYYRMLEQAKGARHASVVAGRLCFRGDPTGQSDYSVVNFPAGTAG
jgi:hypothetical protein